MIPIKLTLKNFCQHAFYEHNYTPGVSGITGNNAAGKTNFSYVGQQFAITGKTNTDKTKKDFLKWGTSSGSTCFEFIHDGLEYVLTRGLHNAKVSLIQVATESLPENEWNQADANDCMNNILGLSPEVFFAVCFIEQGNLWDILIMSHAKRMEYFQKLTDAWQAEGIRKQLDNGLKMIPNYPDRTEVIKQCEENKEMFQSKLKLEEAALNQALNNQTHRQPKTTKAREILLLMSEIVYKKNVDHREDELKAMESKVTFAKEEAAGAPVDPAEYPEALVQKEKEWSLYKGKLELYNAKLGKYEEAVKLQNELIEPPIVTNEKMQKIKVDAGLIKQKIAGVCESCNRPFEGAEDIDREALNNELEALREEWKKENEIWHNEALSREQWLKTNTGLNFVIDSWDKESGNIPEKVEFFPEELVEALQKYKDYETYRKANEANQELMNLLNKKLSDAQAALKICKEMKYISATEAATAQGVIDEANKAEEQIVLIRLEIKQHETNLSNAEASIKVYTDEQETQTKANQLRSRFEKARTILHRDKLPKVVMSSMLKGINHYMATMLCSFNMGFHASLNDDFDFVIEWEGEEKPASVLSGGEKVILAISFHVGLARLLTGNIPFMILDEPTNHIDKHNKPLLRDALMTLKGAGASGCEFFLVTHDEILQPVFDREIEIGKDEE